MNTKLRKRSSRVATVVLCACIGLGVTGCQTVGLNTGGASTNFKLLTSANADDTKNHPANTAFSVSASCAAGQQMIGGGYNLINNSNATPTLVVVEGSYPSTANTWTVQVRNPDNPANYNGDADVAVEVIVYCVATPNYDLSMEIVSQTRTLPSPAGPTTDIDVRCSQIGGLAMAGGFLTTSLPTYTEPGGGGHNAFWPGLLGTGITSFGPRFPDATHSSMGWHATQQYTPAGALTAPQPTVTTTVYALCARKNINAQSYRTVSTAGVLSDTNRLNSTCQTGEFAVSGGYDGVTISFSGSVATISASVAMPSSFAFDTWSIGGDSTGSSINANALCIRIPLI